ncbi:MAG TPA: hypothetical protein VEB18_01865 [Candidatus Paceibacterota bacterium]|nr:hypothetical protein [Candidatus Paceibacterota bacterium]
MSNKEKTGTEETEAAGPFETITVRVGRVPGPINPIILNGRRTVADALSGAGISASEGEIRVNGDLSKVDAALNNGDTVLLVRKIRGN